MKAYNGGSRYFLHIDWEEIYDLENTPLEAQLQRQDGETLDKKVRLQVDDCDGFNFEPENADWDSLREIAVTLSPENYKRLQRQTSYVVSSGMFTADLYVESLEGFI